MSNSRRSYRSAKGAKQDEAFEFDVDDESFTAYPHRVAAGLLIDFQGLTVTRDPEAMWAFFRAAMSGERQPNGEFAEGGGDFERFQEYVNSPKHPVEAEALGDIIKDLLEFTTAHPTEQSSS